MKPEDFGLKVADKDERAILFAKQRDERGWDDSETWSLFVNIAEFVVPRLHRFKELNFGFPSNITSEEWDNKLDAMIRAFELIALDEVCYTKEQDKEIEQGLDLFREWYFDLWW